MCLAVFMEVLQLKETAAEDGFNLCHRPTHCQSLSRTTSDNLTVILTTSAQRVLYSVHCPLCIEVKATRPHHFYILARLCFAIFAFGLGDIPRT